MKRCEILLWCFILFAFVDFVYTAFLMSRANELERRQDEIVQSFKTATFASAFVGYRQATNGSSWREVSNIVANAPGVFTTNRW